MRTLTAALESMKEVKKTNPESQIDKDKIVLLHYTKLHRAPYQYSHKGKSPELYEQEVRNLKDEIKTAGKVLQPILVRKTGVDDYEIIGGQHRRDASELLVIEDGETKYEFCPCIISKMSDAQAEYAAFGTNTNWAKSDWHIMHEIERKKFLLENFPEDFPNIPDKGRMIDKLATEMQMAKSTVGEYLQISKNLSDNAMKSFEAGEMNKSAAVAMASLSHTEQDKLIDAGVTKQKDIKAYKDEITEKTTHRMTITDTIKTVKSASPSTSIVPKFGTYDTDDEELNFGSDVEIVDVVPATVADDDTDYDELKAANEELLRMIEAQNNTNDVASARCGVCKKAINEEESFVFKTRRYCNKCLSILIMDLADEGIISLDMSDRTIKGIAVHS